MPAPKARKAPPSKPPAAKELRPWQLGVFILVGLVIASLFVGVGYAKKSHDEFGEYPWAKHAVPPKMYYAHSAYAVTTAAPPSTLVKVGTTPGGGTIFAPSTARTPAPPTVVVKGGGRTQTYTVAPKK